MKLHYHNVSRCVFIHEEIHQEIRCEDLDDDDLRDDSRDLLNALDNILICTTCTLL